MRYLEQAKYQSQKVKWWLPQIGGRENSYYLMGIECEFDKMKRVIKTDDGNGQTTLGMY